jgi:hypothetical protein
MRRIHTFLQVQRCGGAFRPVLVDMRKVVFATSLLSTDEHGDEVECFELVTKHRFIVVRATLAELTAAWREARGDPPEDSKEEKG